MKTSKRRIELGERLVSKSPRPGQTPLLIEVRDSYLVAGPRFEYRVYSCRVIQGASTSALNTPGRDLEYKPTELRAFFRPTH